MPGFFHYLFPRKERKNRKSDSKVFAQSPQRAQSVFKKFQTSLLLFSKSHLRPFSPFAKSNILIISRKVR